MFKILDEILTTLIVRNFDTRTFWEECHNCRARRGAASKSIVDGKMDKIVSSKSSVKSKSD